ncbi:MAG: flagellar basal body protein, partial [Alphaproteobacteria bacterium]
MELDRAIRIAAAGMDTQSARLRVVAENLANRDTTSEVAGGDPYRRKTVTFANRFDRALGANTVRVARVGTAKGDFPTRHDPTHPAANAQG